MAASLSNLNGPSQIFSPQPKSSTGAKVPTHRPSKPHLVTITNSHLPQNSPSQTNANPPQLSRRASIALVTTTLFTQSLPVGSSHAEDEANGLWLTGPLPVPTVTNKIANEETGTRSFLRKGIYIANIGTDGSAYRIKHYAFDLLGLGDLIGQDAWSYMRKYLCLKSTVMYYDFDKVISAASDEQKEPLLQLANRLFDSFEKLEDAVKKKSDPTIQSCYDETTVILKEVMAKMA